MTSSSGTDAVLSSCGASCVDTKAGVGDAGVSAVATLASHSAINFSISGFNALATKPDSGMIEVCGNNLDDISLAAGRSFFALVPQDAILFNMSIMDNIRMGRLDATEAEIIKAAKMANAHQFIIEFTDGYDTVVGEKGMSVSGGQRQRIAIARAILKNAPIMLMDEATSALDNESERAVNETLQNLKGRMTIIMIAHRRSTIQMADRVISL